MGESCVHRKKIDYLLSSNLESHRVKSFSPVVIGKRCSVLETLSASNNVVNNFLSCDVDYSPASINVQSNYANNNNNNHNNMLHCCNMGDKPYPVPKVKNDHLSHAEKPDTFRDDDDPVYCNRKNGLLAHLRPSTTAVVSENFAANKCSSDASSFYLHSLENGIHKNGFKTYISTTLKDDNRVDSSTSMSKRVSKVNIRSSEDHELSNRVIKQCASTKSNFHHQKLNNSSPDKGYNSEKTRSGCKISQSLSGKLKLANSNSSSGGTPVDNFIDIECSLSAGRKITTNDLTPDNTPRTGFPCPNYLPILEEMRLPISSSDTSSDSPRKEILEGNMNRWLAEKNKLQREEEKRRHFLKNHMLVKEQEKKARAEKSTAIWIENKIKQAKENQKREKEKKAKELKEKIEKLKTKEFEKKKIELWCKRKEEALLRKQIEEHNKKLQAEERKQMKQEESARAYNDWLKRSKNKPKPLPSNRGLESIISSSCVAYKNPTPWQPNIPDPFPE